MPAAPFAKRPFFYFGVRVQDAVDAATVAGAVVVVSNGVYATGGRAGIGTMTNRAVVDKPLVLRSANGPEWTVIQGAKDPVFTNGNSAIRCVYLANNAFLSGFTLTNGATLSYESGGGVWCESATAVVSNCVLIGNSARNGGGAYDGTLDTCMLTSNSASANPYSSGGAGGGACLSTLNNCTLTGNSASRGGGPEGSGLNNCSLTGNSARDYGGGTEGGVLNNCTLTGNSAWMGGGANSSTLNNCTLTGNTARGYGGGAYGGALNNCIVYFNTAPDGANYHYATLNYLNYCCTTPLPWEGVGNITNAPFFVDYAGGNLRLQSNSPCINAGLNAYAPGPTDLHSNPRIVSGAVDIGAYEFQGSGSVISYAWLQGYGLPTDGLADAADPDADGHTTWQEWRCQTDPTNALSVLRLLSASRAGTNVSVAWRSVPGVSYFLERSTNLSASPPFTLLAPDLPGQPGLMSFTDTNAAAAPRLFYRVGVP